MLAALLRWGEHPIHTRRQKGNTGGNKPLVSRFRVWQLQLRDAKPVVFV